MKFTSKYKIVALFIFLTLIFSCKTQKASKTKDLQNTELSINYPDKGYVKAIIIHIENADEPCSFLIELENNDLLEPLTLSDDFKVNNTGIWLKYIRQRRPNRCSGAFPIEINDIKERE